MQTSMQSMQLRGKPTERQVRQVVRRVSGIQQRFVPYRFRTLPAHICVGRGGVLELTKLGWVNGQDLPPFPTARQLANSFMLINPSADEEAILQLCGDVIRANDHPEHGVMVPGLKELAAVLYALAA